MEKWGTSEQDEDRLEWVVDRIPDQGTWGTSYVRYKLDQTNKIAYVIAKNRAHPPEAIEDHCRLMVGAFFAIGWQVMDEGGQ